MNKVLITGASSGVGRSLANYFYNKGFELILISRRGKFVEEDFADSNRISYYEIDLSDGKSAEELILNISKYHGYIPLIINNAGVMVKEDIVDLKWDSFQADINVNARIPLFIMQTFLKEMKINNFGRIVNITSGAPINCFPHYSRYSASKGLLNIFSITLSKEVGDYDIKINLMSPGPVKSEMAPNAKLSPDICHPTVEYLLTLPKDGPSGKFFWLGYEIPITPDLEGIDWLNGTAVEKFKKVING